MSNTKKLIETMKYRGILTTPCIIRAFEYIDRADFVLPTQRAQAYEDYPLPIGFSQTISQPSTVAFMLELLAPKEGESVLDIGSGSGWSTALLGAIVGKSGNVIGLERVDEVRRFGAENLKRYGFSNCRIEAATKELGKPDELFDAILVSASAKDFPHELLAQLAVGGRLVIPIKNSIWKFFKRTEHEVVREEYFGFRFVPLVY